MERPIIFSAPMVRALRAGAKSQTRRLVERLTDFGKVLTFGPSDTPGYAWHFRDPKTSCWNDLKHDRAIANCPYGKVGDTLWVRENWKCEYVGPADDIQVTYYGDSEKRRFPLSARPNGWIMPKTACKGRVVPSIYLPRFASRILLELTDVRLQRLQDISPEDALAEGVRDDIDHGDHATHRWCAVEAYERLWDSLHGPYPWSANPTVWALTFKVLDQIGAKP